MQNRVYCIQAERGSCAPTTVGDSHVAAAKSKARTNPDVPDSLGRPANMSVIGLNPNEPEAELP